MLRIALSLLLLTTLCACDPPKPSPSKLSPSTAAPEAKAEARVVKPKAPLRASLAPGACKAAKAERVDLVTEDGVALIADHYGRGIKGGRGVVLLHMIPPHHTLDNYPPELIEPLVAAGFEVINVNRRGAPGSGGEAEEAYKGDKGKLDALAGVRFLLSSPCRVDPARVAIIGASNGTTSMVDYAVHAHHSDDPEIPVPAAFVFLSGGGFTEAQNPVSKHLDALGSRPAFFAYPVGEAKWNETVEALAKDRGLASWSFHRYEPGDHGTKLFTTDPDLIATLVAWLDQHVPT